MATAISSLFSFGARHERVPTTEQEGVNNSDEINNPNRDTEAAVENTVSNHDNSDNNNITSSNVDVGEEEEEEETASPRLVRATSTSSSNNNSIIADDEDVEAAATEDVDGDDDDDDMHLTSTIPRLSTRAGTVTLSELEEERELARRRTSACVLLAVFVLFRLWVEALQNGDVFVMMLCLFGTSWTARLIRHNREREEALDERIRAYLENADPNTTEIDRNDLRFLSFQAQLALAMMESQRQMQNGGYGNPDGHSGSSGVSEDAKQKWEHFSFKEGMESIGNGELNTHSNPLPSSSSPSKATTKGGYGSVALNDQGKGYEEDGPHCSICLGEYEDGEKLVKLPCNHIYHDDCVSSWTTNHTRCPLCNCDLESVTSSEPTLSEESIV